MHTNASCFEAPLKHRASSRSIIDKAVLAPILHAVTASRHRALEYAYNFDASQELLHNH